MQWVELTCALVWLTLSGWLSGSLWRSLHRQPDALGTDDIWAVVCMCAAWIAMYHVRRLSGLAPIVPTGDLVSAYGLRATGVVLVAAFAWVRVAHRGWRW